MDIADVYMEMEMWDPPKDYNVFDLLEKEIKKNDPSFINKDRKSFTEMQKVIENAIRKYIKLYKKKPSEEELMKYISKINLELQNELKRNAEKLFKKTYTEELDKVGKELGINILFDTVDQNAIATLANQAVLYEAFAGISETLTKKLHQIIIEAYHTDKGLSAAEITNKLKEALDIADYQAERIARTETAKVSAAARKNSYAKEDDFNQMKFKHIGPDDDRTTNLSKRIKARTKNGVSWDEYVRIVQEEAAKDFPEWVVNPDFPVSHYNSRHTFIRIK